MRPADWKSTAPEPLPGTATFAAQPNLPKLPLQQRLLKRANEKPHWLEEWSDDAECLGRRNTVCISIQLFC